MWIITELGDLNLFIKCWNFFIVTQIWAIVVALVGRAVASNDRNLPVISIASFSILFLQAALNSTDTYKEKRSRQVARMKTFNSDNLSLNADEFCKIVWKELKTIKEANI